MVFLQALIGNSSGKSRNGSVGKLVSGRIVTKIIPQSIDKTAKNE